MRLPKAVRRLTPGGLRDSVRLRAMAVGSGLIPPRTMHTQAESELLERLAAGQGTVVEIGVYEGSSAVRLCRALSPGATLHLVDPYIENALRPGSRGTETATRRVVTRAARAADGPALAWHVELSEQTAARWSAPIDMVFIDGDHSEAGCQLDWDLWSPWVRHGGVAVLHDAREGQPGGWGLPGPTTVADRLFRDPGSAPSWRLLEEVDSAVAVERTVGGPAGPAPS